MGGGSSILISKGEPLIGSVGVAISGAADALIPDVAVAAEDDDDDDDDATSFVDSTLLIVSIDVIVLLVVASVNKISVGTNTSSDKVRSVSVVGFRNELPRPTVAIAVEGIIVTTVTVRLCVLRSSPSPPPPPPPPSPSPSSFASSTPNALFHARAACCPARPEKDQRARSHATTASALTFRQ